MAVELLPVLTSSSETRNVLSFDIEENWMGEFVRKNPKVEKNFHANETIPPLLDLLDEFKTKATMFIVGNAINDETLKLISERGHEIGFHTDDHVPLWEKEVDGYMREIRDFKKRVGDVTGQDCIGFRAPSFSMNEITKNWAIHGLWSFGYLYDSSVFPSLNPLYGQAGASKVPYLNKGFPEFPMSVGPLGLPVAGGFYHRFFPERLLKWAISKIPQLNIYAHNWELFPRGEKLEGLSTMARFYCYHGLDRTLPRFRRILERHKFTTFRSVLTNHYRI
jgi:hypothetical protein